MFCEKVGIGETCAEILQESGSCNVKVIVTDESLLFAVYCKLFMFVFIFMRK